MVRLFSITHWLQIFLVIALPLLIGATEASAQTTKFTYQGRLQDGGTPANGTHDLQFTLWDAVSGGTQQPQPTPVTVTRTSVLVTGGVFTVSLDFGANACPGAIGFWRSGCDRVQTQAHSSRSVRCDQSLPLRMPCRV